ncbi:MAG: class I SAM-dependent methyltransferase [Myxococcota bacterium]|nr:class I SAM-dependent methyltransferase [Myxococcota bacterium]
MVGSLSPDTPIDEVGLPLLQAIDARRPLLERLESEDTDCYRLFHGATEGCPGLAVDRYGSVLLVQSWGRPLAEGALPRIGDRVCSALGLDLVTVWNHRGGGHTPFERLQPAPDLSDAVGREAGLLYSVDPRHGGRDPLLFLDFRSARARVRSESAGRSVLNLFAYTCGVGVAALAGGASELWNVDFSAGALELGGQNLARNGFGAERFRQVQEEAVVVTRQLAGLPVKGRGARRRRFQRFSQRAFDLVVLDPPAWATGPFGAVDLVRDYPGVFKPALLATRPGGRMLVTNNVASVDLEDWLEILHRAARKAGRPIADLELLEPESDFPSPDGRFPLKMALLQV